MSTIDSLTGDEFMSLSPNDHQVALDQYEAAIDHALHFATSGNLDPAERDGHLDRLTSLLTLRKLHKVRLEEMVGEEQPVLEEAGA